MHTNLTRRTSNISEHAKRAAKRVADEGGSPRAQIDAARAASDRPLSYLPHSGAKERARNLKRMAKSAK